MSDLTICEDCFSAVVRPEADKGVAFARDIDPIPAPVSYGFTCQLYSERMRNGWKAACVSGDFGAFQRKASHNIPSLTSLPLLNLTDGLTGYAIFGYWISDRRAKEREFQIGIGQLKQQHQQLMEQVNVQNAMTAISIGTEANRVSNNILLDGIGVTYDVDAYHYGRPDTSVSATQDSTVIIPCSNFAKY